MKRLLLLVLLSLLPSVTAWPEQPTTASAIRIVLAGDSTVTDHAGWGKGFAAALTSDVQVINTALGGRSSKSFRDEGHWDKALAEKGDYLLIQFGHNDQPGKGPQRETGPASTFPANLKRFIEEARAAGFKPVLVTSLVRRHFDENGKIRDDLAAYVEATRKIAVENDVPLLDLSRLSIEYCNSVGEGGCKAISPLNQDGTIDTTHLNAEGGKVIGKMVAVELARILPELAAHVRPESSHN